MKYHKCPIKNQHACWLNLDKKTRFCPPRARCNSLQVGPSHPGSSRQLRTPGVAGRWDMGVPPNHPCVDGFSLLSIRGTSIFRNPPSDGFCGTWNWWHQRIWWDLVNFGINHHYSAIIHHYYGDFTIIQPLFTIIMGISPLFSHEVGWPQVGFFRQRSSPEHRSPFSMHREWKQTGISTGIFGVWNRIFFKRIAYDCIWWKWLFFYGNQPWRLRMKSSKNALASVINEYSTPFDQRDTWDIQRIRRNRWRNQH